MQEERNGARKRTERREMDWAQFLPQSISGHSSSLASSVQTEINPYKHVLLPVTPRQRDSEWRDETQMTDKYNADQQDRYIRPSFTPY